MHKKSLCGLAMVAHWLLVIGGINWGLVGLGALFGANWNVVALVVGWLPYVEHIVYILVGVSAIIEVVGCPCPTCKAGRACCGSCKHDDMPATPAADAMMGDGDEDMHDHMA